MRARLSLALATVVCLGCGSGALPKPPVVDPTEQWTLAEKKVDYAVSRTKVMIQQANGAAYLPDLYMRLAELYSERARYAWLIAYERHRARGDDSHSVESPEARLLKNLAIGTYSRVLREFPSYPRNDEALFLSGHEYRELGDFDKMTEAYQKLIETYPNSTHRLEAFLALGDHAFDGSDLPTAEKYYKRILAAPVSPVHPLARYKLAWVHVNQQDCKGAVALFETNLKERLPGASSQAHLLSTQKDINVLRESLVDLAYCYPDVYPNQPFLPYFRALATTTVDYLAAVRKVANRFAIKEMWAQSARALREVVHGNPADEDAPELVRRFHDAALKGELYDDPRKDIEDIVAVLDARVATYHVDAAARKRLTDEFELYARDLATRAQVAAKANQNVEAMSNVADAYHAYLLRFPPSAVTEDIRQNYIDALVASKRQFDAGRAYEELEASTKKPDTKKLARLNGIAAYQQALEDKSLNRLDRVIAWGGIRQLGRRVIIDTPNEPAIAGIKLSIARSYYEDGEYEKSAELFYALARQYPTTNEGVAAANLALDALRLADNLEALTTIGRWLVADTRIREDVRRDLNEIVRKAAQRQVEEVTASDSGDREEQLLAMAKRHKGSEIGEEAFYNTLLVAKSNGEIDRFYQLGEQFITDYPTSSRRADVLNALSQVASDSGNFTKAAAYESAAFAANPQAKDAADKLVAAASMHAVLGDPAAGDEVTRLAERGNDKVDDLLVLLARVGDMAALDQVLAKAALNRPTATFFTGYAAFRHADFSTAQSILSKLQGATPELTVRAHFLLGEISYTEFRGIGQKGDLASTIDANAKALANVDRAFKPVIEGGEARWAMLGVARLADAHARYGALLRGLQPPPGLSPADQQALKTALEGQAADQDKRAAEFKNACIKQSEKNELFSEASKSCLLNQPLPDTIALYSESPHKATEPPGAVPLRLALLKNAKDTDALGKLSELYLGAGDTGSALLLLERAEPLGGRKAVIQNLLGITYLKLNEPQEAGEAFKAAVAAEPNDPHWRLNLAAHYAAFGYVDRAKAELKKAGPPPPSPRSPADHPDIGLLSNLGAEKAEKKGGS
jgi:tetratricopeptide (TPR) repeat protein